MFLTWTDLFRLHTSITGGRICPYLFSSLYFEHRDSPPCCAQGMGSSTGSAPELPGWQRVLMPWQADLMHRLLLMISEHSWCCGIWEETFRIASGRGAWNQQAAAAAAWRWPDLPKVLWSVQGWEVSHSQQDDPPKCTDLTGQCLQHLLYWDQDGGVGGTERHWLGHSRGMRHSGTAKGGTTCTEAHGPWQGPGSSMWGRGLDVSWGLRPLYVF